MNVLGKMQMRTVVEDSARKAMCFVARAFWEVRGRVACLAGQAVREDEGQSTTEYAIILGVIVVIAIGAILAVKGTVQGLWDTIVAAFSGI